jgi:HlyD family secretion protein
VDDNQDIDLPLADLGLQPVAAAPRRGWPPVLVLGAAGALLVIGAIGGMYIQGPVVRAFFALSGLEPGGGALREPIAVSAPAPALAAAPSGGIVALGRLQPVGSVIEVAGPTTAQAPRVLDLLVQEGDVVALDAPMVVLDTHPQALAARDAAARAVDVAEATLEQARRDVRVGNRESGAALDAARAAADQAERDLARQRQLFAGEAIPASQLEVATATAEQARAELRRAEAATGRLDSTDIRLAEKNLEAVRAELVRAEAELRSTTVFAPSTGTVLSIDVSPGERAPSGTLLTLADLSRIEAEIEVYQEAVPRLAVGMPVRLESSVLGAPLHGTVRRIGLEVGRQSLTSSDPAANTDARVVKAWVELDAASTPVAARFVGLEVIGHIDVEPTP